mgnify:CR=1 FL=1
MIFGGLDGILTSFAIVAGAAGGNLSTNVVLILGFSNIFAGIEAHDGRWCVRAIHRACKHEITIRNREYAGKVFQLQFGEGVNGLVGKGGFRRTHHLHVLCGNSS